MSAGFQGAIERMLPPKVVNGRVFRPKVTTSGGVRQDAHASRKGRKHGGVDINYHYGSGSPLGQNGINLQHPPVGSPVSGKIIELKKEGWGKIVIEDANGLRHELMHLHNIDEKKLKKGMYVKAGQVIGTMGGRGPKGPNEYAQHVHYSITSPNNTVVDPEFHWNNASSEKGRFSSLWDKEIEFRPASVLDKAAQQKLRNLSQGTNILGDGETLRREGDMVWRIEPDGSTRGYFVSE